MTGAWRLALRNLRRHRRRNAVTALAVAVGYTGLVVLFGYAGWSERLMRVASVYNQHRGHLAVYAAGGLKRAEAIPSRYALTPEAQEKIVAALRADPRVEAVGRYLRGSGVAGNGCKSFQMRAVGVELALERRIEDHPEVVALFGHGAAQVSGRPLFDAPGVDVPVVLAPVLARALEKQAAPATAPDPAPVDCAAPDVLARIAADPFVQLGGRSMDGSFGAVDGQVVGVYRAASTEESKTLVVAPLDLLQRLYGTDRVTYVAAFLRDGRDLAAVEAQLVARLRADGLDVSVHRFDDPAANPYYVGTMAFVRAMILFIVVLVMNVVAFSVLNAMTLAAMERAREMGTLRALGFTRSDLTGLFLRESALLTSFALGAGAALAEAAVVGVRAAGIRFVPPGSGTEVVLQLLPPPAAWAGLAAAFLFLTVSATWFAVRRKARSSVTVLLAEVAA